MTFNNLYQSGNTVKEWHNHRAQYQKQPSLQEEGKEIRGGSGRTRIKLKQVIKESGRRKSEKKGTTPTSVAGMRKMRNVCLQGYGVGGDRGIQIPRQEESKREKKMTLLTMGKLIISYSPPSAILRNRLIISNYLVQTPGLVSQGLKEVPW